MDISTSECETASPLLEDYNIISDMNGCLPNFTVVVCNNEENKLTDTDNVYLNNYLTPLSCTSDDEQCYNNNTESVKCISENSNDFVVLENSTINLCDNAIPGCTYVEYSHETIDEIIESNCQIVEYGNGECNVKEEPYVGCVEGSDFSHDCVTVLQNAVNIEDLELEKYVTFLVKEERSELTECSVVPEFDILEPPTPVTVAQHISDLEYVKSKKRKHKDLSNNYSSNLQQKIVMHAGATKKQAMEIHGPDVTSKNVFMKRYFCSLCNRDFVSKTVLQYHVLSKHKKDQKNVRVILKIVRLYSCEYCRSCFLGRRNLKIHVSKSHNEYCVSEKRPKMQTCASVDVPHSDVQSSASLGNITVENDSYSKHLRSRREITSEDISNDMKVETVFDQEIVISNPRSLKKTSTYLTDRQVNLHYDKQSSQATHCENKISMSGTSVRSRRSRQEIQSEEQSDKLPTVTDHRVKIATKLKPTAKSPSQHLMNKFSKNSRNKKLKPVSTQLTQQELLDSPQTKFYCELCSRYFRNGKMLEVHSRLTHPVETCNNVKHKNVELCDLVENMLDERHFCPVCDYHFPSVAAACKHIDISHPDDDFAITCKRITKRNASITYCKICKEPIRSVYSHYSTKHRAIYSKHELLKFQTKKFVNKKSTQIVQKRIQNNNNSEFDAFSLSRLSRRACVWKCDICCKNFKDKFSLREHVDINHVKSTRKKSCSTSVDNKKLSSNVESNTESTSILWNYLKIAPNSSTADHVASKETSHKDPQSNVASSVCNNTDNNVASNGDTVINIDKENFIEVQEMRYVCTICNAHFSNRTCIYKHISLKHTNENLSLIFKNSKLELRNMFKCINCSTLCVSKQYHLKNCEILLDANKKHRYRHGGLILPIACVQPISCAHCKKSLQTKYSKLQLAIHSMEQHLHILESQNVKFGIHVTVKKYKCPYCPESFKLLQLLNSHICAVHSDILYSSTDVSISETQLWKCQVCFNESNLTKLYKSTEHFLKHLCQDHNVDCVEEIVNIHTGTEPRTKQMNKYECVVCGWFTLHKLSMFKHMQKHPQKLHRSITSYLTSTIELKMCSKCLKYFMGDTDFEQHTEDCKLHHSVFNRNVIAKKSRKVMEDTTAIESIIKITGAIDESKNMSEDENSEDDLSREENLQQEKCMNTNIGDTNKDKKAITLDNYPPKKVTRNRFLCPYCPKHYGLQKPARYHIKESHKEENVNVKIQDKYLQIYLCKLCPKHSSQKYFSTNEEYREHFEKHILETQIERNIPEYDVLTIKEHVEIYTRKSKIKKRKYFMHKSDSSQDTLNTTELCKVPSEYQPKASVENENGKEDSAQQGECCNKMKEIRDPKNSQTESNSVSLENYPPTKVTRLRYVCPYCIKHFNVKTYARNHIDDLHQGENMNVDIKRIKLKNYFCKLCVNNSSKKYFDTEDDYKEHFKEKHNKLQTNSNNEEKNTQEHISGEKKRNKKPKSTNNLKYSKTQISKTITLENHPPANVVKKRNLCPICKKHFSVHSSIKEHMRMIHKNIREFEEFGSSKRVKVQMLMCNLCPKFCNVKYFTSVESYNLHFKRLHETNKNVNNEQTCESNKNLSSDLTSNFEKCRRHFVYVCRECKREYNNYKDIYVHVCKCHNKCSNTARSAFIKKIVNFFQCVACAFKTDNLKVLYNHVLSCHDKNYYNSAIEVKQAIDYCFSKLETECKMSRIEVYRYFCPHCYLTFTKPKNCSKHINQAHSNEDPYKFTDQFAYVYKCKYCDKICSYYSDVKSHIAQHHTKKVETKLLRYPSIKLKKTSSIIYLCSFCNMQFSDKQSFYSSSAHLKIHKEHLEKCIIKQQNNMWICNLCKPKSHEQCYEDKKLYALHLMSCHKLYIDERYLVQNHESTFIDIGENVKDLNTKSEPIMLQDKEEVTTMNCDLCDQNFHDNHLLKNHMILNHNNCTENMSSKTPTVKYHYKKPFVDLQILPLNLTENYTTSASKVMQLMDSIDKNKVNHIINKHSQAKSKLKQGNLPIKNDSGIKIVDPSSSLTSQPNTDHGYNNCANDAPKSQVEMSLCPAVSPTDPGVVTLTSSFENLLDNTPVNYLTINHVPLLNDVIPISIDEHINEVVIETSSSVEINDCCSVEKKK